MNGAITLEETSEYFRYIFLIKFIHKPASQICIYVGKFKDF